MRQKVLIVPDKFKGTLTARAAAAAIARGWRQTRPGDDLEQLPMSDGGDGFGGVMSALLGAKPQQVKTVDAAHRPGLATWWWQAKTKTAIVESATVIGLAMLSTLRSTATEDGPPGKFHPFELDTFGMGAVLRAARAKGAKEILVGIGGSATNDGGFGLARALGWKFCDAHGHLIAQWNELSALAEIHPPKSFRFGKVIVAVDVQNPLLGSRGATQVYGPQKGLRPENFPVAERCLRQLARVAKRQTHHDCAIEPGAGAAGGLGFGLAAFLGARLEPGFELFAKHAKLSHRLRAVDLVVTGEGAIDRSTLMGKGVGQIARQCRALGIPCVGLAGVVVRVREMKQLFVQLHGLTDLTTSARAKARPTFWLERLAAQAAASLQVAGCLRM